VSAVSGGPAGDANTSPFHVDDRDDQRKERPKQHDDVSRSPFEEHSGSVEQDDGDENAAHQVWEPTRFVPAPDVIREMKRKQEDQQQERDA